MTTSRPSPATLASFARRTRTANGMNIANAPNIQRLIPERLRFPATRHHIHSLELGWTMARTISTTISTGVTLAPGDDPLTITATGYVSGPNGIEGPSSQSWTITNQNTVLGTTGYGISLAAGGTITNASGALISGQAGIFIDTPDLNNPAGASVSNAGTILATAGANLAIY